LGLKVATPQPATRFLIHRKFLRLRSQKSFLVRKLWPGPNPNPSHVYLHLNRQQKQHRFTMSCHFPGIVDRLLSFSGHVQISACHEYQMPTKKGLIEQLLAGSVAGKKREEYIG